MQAARMTHLSRNTWGNWTQAMNVAMKTWAMQCWPEWVMQHNYNKLESLHGLVEFFTWWCPVTFVGL